MNKLIPIIILIFGLGVNSYGQSAIVKDFKPVCDSLNTLIGKDKNVTGKLRLKNVMKRGNILDFYFTESLGDYPWREGDTEWFREELENLFPDAYRSYRLGVIYSKKITLDRLETSELGFDGTPSDFRHRTGCPETIFPLVKNADRPEYGKGLHGRNIALWQSHGLYYSHNEDSWIWQRPCLFQTVEDMFTQSFVLPYLVPMLENAGAYVLIPRERDPQPIEIISDFDMRNEAYGSSFYEEKGKWRDAGRGFAALKAEYTGAENPFRAGTARQTECIGADGKKEATAVWRPDIPERGEYAVYISYKSLPESSKAVKYTVNHNGGRNEFIVNQTIGGGTWIYLGTFEFDRGDKGNVTVSNMTPEGYKHEKGSVVTADAVKFGGGMGNIARKCADDEGMPSVSGYPRFVEAARYWLQWSGADSTIFCQNRQKDDYRDDFMSRGDWVEWISRGSHMNKSKKGGLGIPVDLSLGFHSDAGVTPNDSLVGTLAIYTLRSDGSEKLPSGESRMTSREFADLVQSQIVHDIQKEFNPQWSRRCVWDRGYRESRTPSCPSMLLELLSHQNFADMKYGLDPTFRFTVGRAVYKGMLKYLSNRYGIPYMVQPLPVQRMGVSFGNGSGKEYKAVISWRETEDSIEPTAKPYGFILQTRIDDGGFDTGRIVSTRKDESGLYTTEISLKPGHIYSFRITAFNDGGQSFPSETVSIGVPKNGSTEKKVLIVNNFDRVSGPAFIDTPSYAGFDNRLDSGVPYVKDNAFVGEMYEFRRESEYVSNTYPGFGASYDDHAGRTVAGNTFDYPYVHGKAVLKAGYPFYSCSNETFAADSTFAAGAWAADLICGKQVTTVVGSMPEQKFKVFPYEIQDAVKRFTSNGGHILISGANIATDVWDSVYPVQTDSLYKVKTAKFVRETLGYKWIRNNAGKSGSIRFVDNETMRTKDEKDFNFHNEINSSCYCVESPDGIAPANAKKGSTFMRYGDTKIAAGVCHEGDGYMVVSFGFPIETLKRETDINRTIKITLDFFDK